MCNRLTIKATKFQQSSANRFELQQKNCLGGKFAPPPPYKLGLKRIHTYHNVQFRCVRAAHSRVGEDRARPTQVLIASEWSGRS